MDKKNINVEVVAQSVIDAVIQKKPEFSRERLMKAFHFANKAHEGQIRKDGTPFITHPLSVVIMLLKIDCDETMLISAMLHDTVEDTKITIEDIKKEFGSETAEIVEGLTKIHKFESIGLDRQVGSIRKMILAMSKDIRVIFIKLADRVHNMSTLYHLPLEKQQRIAQETLSIYAPIATRLGIYCFKDLLESSSFKILYSEDYKSISDQLNKYINKKEKVLEIAVSKIKEKLKEDNISFKSISWRIKEKFSIFKKLKKRDDNDLQNLYDIFAIRIILDNVEDCYRILGVIHKHWTHLPQRLKDYITVPKANGYQSFHTTIIGLGKSGKAFKPIEIQIRTNEMHNIAEKGVAAHWAYKDNKKQSANAQKDQWLQSLVSLAGEIEVSSDEFLQNIAEDQLKARIFVITPKGDIKDLPEGSTPIDFAYAIHSDLGDHISSAKVNGKIAPLESSLKNGDMVTININKNRSPNASWINMVKTNQAKQSIRIWLRNQSSEDLLGRGREEINKFLKKFEEPPLDSQFSLLKNYKQKSLSLKERESILKQVGEGSIKASDIVKNIFDTRPKFHSTRTSNASDHNNKNIETPKILILGDNTLETRLANCCTPKPGEKISGFITRGGYVSIHHMDCSFVKNQKEDRFVECHWEGEELPFTVKFSCNMQNIQGVTSRILEFFSKQKFNLLDLHLITNKARNNACASFYVEVFDLEQLRDITQQIKGIEGITNAKMTIKSEKE